MNNYERLAASTYVVDSFREVSEVWRHYEDHGDDDSLARVAHLICGTLKDLSGDSEFWAAAIDAAKEAGERSEAVSEVLADLSEFRHFEEYVLIEAGIPREDAARFASELICAIRMSETRLDGDAVVNLQGRVRDLGKAVCEVASAGQAKREKRRRLVWRGFKVLKGAATVVVDGVATPGLPMTLLSISGGLVEIADAVFEE